MAPLAAEAAPDAALLTASPVPDPHAVRPAVPATATPATIRLSRRDQQAHAGVAAAVSGATGVSGSVVRSVLIVVLTVVSVPRFRAGRTSITAVPVSRLCDLRTVDDRPGAPRARQVRVR